MGAQNYKIFDGYQPAVDGNGKYNFTTQWVDVFDAFAFGISVSFTGNTPTGSLQLNASNEDKISLTGGVQAAYGATQNMTFGEQPRYNGLDSTVVTTPGTSVVAISATGTTQYELAQRGFRWVQIQYTGSAGSQPTINLWFTKKFTVA
jgi:hypothetical protein